MAERLAGLLIPVFALRHDDDLGIGDTKAVKDAITFLRDEGVGLLQVLPINETGGDNSPYNAISSVALDPVTINLSPDTVPGLTADILERLAPIKVREELKEGPVDYPRVKSLKEEILQAAFDRFDSEEIARASARAQSFKEFEAEHAGWLPAYTLFRTLMHEHDGNASWPTWAPELQTLAGAERWLAQDKDSERLKRYRKFCAYVQWVSFSQWLDVRAWADKQGIKLMGDIPFGVSRYSADVWSERELFDLEWSGGAPPEPFFKTDLFTQKWGQNWGIPLYKWQAHVDQDFAWWRQRVARVGDFFHYFRIDHVLGFFRVYAFPWIPERNGEFVELSNGEASKLTGGRLPQFVPYPDEPWEYAEMNGSEGAAILKIILEAAGGMGVVAEDLGVVPPYVRPVLRALSIPGFYIPPFERNPTNREYKPMKTVGELTLATYATHDHEPLAAYYDRLVEWWLGPDGHEGWMELTRMMRFLSLDDEKPPKSITPELHRRLTQVLMESNARFAVFMITDVLLSKQRFNAPGSASESNWSQRLDRPLSAYRNEPETGRRLAMFAEVAGQCGRGLAGAKRSSSGQASKAII